MKSGVEEGAGISVGTEVVALIRYSSPQAALYSWVKKLSNVISVNFNCSQFFLYCFLYKKTIRI